MTPRCRRGCGNTVPIFGLTCAVCTRVEVERTPRTQAGRDALRRTIERRVAEDEARRARLRAGLDKTRAALAAAAARRPDEQPALW